MRRMLVVIDSISCRMWLETMMLLPCFAQSRIMRIVRRRPSGSIPDSGSSRMSSSRIVDERLGELDPLSHALAVGADALAGGIHQIDRRRARARPPDARPCLSSPFRRASAVDPLEPGHPVVEGVLLRTEPDPEVRATGCCQIGCPSTRTSPLLGRSWPVMSFRNVLLPAPFGPSRPVMPERHADRHIVQADDLAVPLGEVVGDDDGLAHETISTPRTRAVEDRRSTRRQGRSGRASDTRTGVS